MDVLPRFTAQCFELFRSMSPARRVTSIAIALAIVVGFGALLISNGRVHYQPVSQGKAFVGAELSAAELALKSLGFNDFRRDGQRLLVPAQDLDRCNAALADLNALPADLGSQMLKHFETLGPFSTDRQRQQMKEALLLQELRSTIKGIPGIEDARVAVASSDRRHGWNQKPRTTANVSLKSAPGHEITPALVNSLRHVVANMVPDLKPVDVTIFDLARGHAYHGDQVQVPVEDRTYPQSQAILNQYEQQIRKGLSHIPDVAVAVQLDPNHTAPSVSRPTQREGRTESDAGPNRPSTTSERDSHATAFRGTELELSDSVGSPEPLKPDVASGLRVSVSIPRDYLRQLASSRSTKSKRAALDPDSPFLEEEVTATVERIVQRLIPPTSTDDAISVTFIDRVPNQSAGDSPTITMNQLFERFDHVQLAIGSVAALLTVVALGWFTRRPTSAPTPISPVTEFAEVAVEPPLSPAEVIEMARPIVPIVDRMATLRDEIRVQAASDTVAAATVLGQWLSDATSTTTNSEVDIDRQSAIILLSLDRTLATDVLAKLPREQVEQITFAIAKAENVTRDEQERVLRSFQAAFLARPLMQPAGPETARNLLERTLEQDDVDAVQQSIDLQVKAGPFAFLHHRHPDDIRQLIQDEHSQTIALVISQLSPPLAAQVLAGLAPVVQADVLGRIARLGPTDIEVLTDIASLLGQRIGRTPIRTGGLEHAADLLQETRPALADSVLRTLDQRDSKSADAIKDELFSFNELELLDDATLRLVLERTNQFRWSVALKGASVNLRQRILGSVASPLAKALRSEFESMGPLPLSEISIVQRQIAATIRDLSEAAEIPLPSRTQRARTSAARRDQGAKSKRTA